MPTEKKRGLDWDDIFENLKGMLPGWATNAANGAIESFFGMFSGFFELIGMGSEVNDAKQKVKGFVSEKTQSFTKSVDPDLAVVQSGSLKAVNACFDKMKTGFGLSDEHFNKLKQSAVSMVNEFYKNGIPAVDPDQGLALAAPQAIEEYRKSIITYLIGGSGKAGALPLNDPKRTEKAERIATLITGMTAEDTWQTIATKQDGNGLVGSLATAQRKRYAANFVKGSMTESDTAITVDTQLLASTVQNPGTSAGSNASAGDNQTPGTTPGAQNNQNKAAGK